MKKNIVLALTAMVLGASCSQDSSTALREGIQPRDEVKAAAKISQSFKVEKKSGQDLGKAWGATEVWIKRSALEKEFLLQAAFIPQVPAAAGSGIKSRVVSFRLKEGSLFMMEATQGHTVTEELPQNLILAKFPILGTKTENGSEHILFDFNSGMSKVLTYGDWYSSDEGTEYEGNEKLLESLDVRLSFIEEAKMPYDSFLMIRQVVQGVQRNVMKSDEDSKESPVRENLFQAEVRYYLAPYLPDATYQPVATPGFDRVGYFEVAPQAKIKGGTHVRASRFHPEKPIVFAVSANTPPEYVQAVKDGILYWNRAFGKEVLKAELAPVGVTAPDPSMNVVQWVTWDLAGFAYADAQMDPRSGEILHAQVYMTSVFAFMGKARMRSLARHLENAVPPTPGQVGIAGFDSATVCRRDFNKRLLQMIETLESTGANDAQILKASQDYVREVVAHEIGHTLGLRHNFAGNTVANYAANERPEILKKYLAGDESIKDVVTSSSVMEYQVYLESIISGHHIAGGQPAMSYDRAVVGTLYLGEKIDRVRIPLFCTDHHADSLEYADCHRFDYGSSSVEYSASIWNETLGGVAKEILEKYIRAKSPLEGEEVVEVADVQLKGSAAVAQTALEGQLAFLRSLTNAGKVLQIHRRYSAVNEMNDQAVIAEQEKYLSAELTRLGGMPEVLPTLEADWADQVSAEFAALLEKNQKGIGYSGEYQFTAEEKAYLLTHVPNYLKKVQKAATTAQFAHFNLADAAEVLKDKKFRDAETTNQLMTYFGEIATEALTAVSGETFETEVSFVDEETKKPRKETIKIPLYSVPLAVKESAVKLLAADHGVAIDHGVMETEALKAEWTEFSEKHAPAWLLKVPLEDMPQTLRRWVMETKKVNQLLADE